MDRKRRTYPGYLSRDEAAGDSRRTSDMVRSISKQYKQRDIIRRKSATNLLKSSSVSAKPEVRLSHTTPVGETNYFKLDFNDKDKIVSLYGKEIPKGYPFQIRLSLNETVGITRLLEKALAIKRNNPYIIRIGENSSIIVEYDGSLGRVVLFKKEKAALCQFKLAFDQYETKMMIRFLKKAKSFFWH